MKRIVIESGHGTRKMFFALTAFSFLLNINIIQASTGTLPDEAYERKYTTNSHLVRGGIESELPFTNLDLKFVLDKLDIKEHLNHERTSTPYGSVFFTDSYAIKIPAQTLMDQIDIGAEETKRLLWVKAWTKAKPPYGLSMCLPSVFVNLEKIYRMNPSIKKNYHINVAKRIKGVCNFYNEIKNSLYYGNESSKKLVSDFGYRVGQNQVNFLIPQTKKTAMHGDLNPKNVIVTKEGIGGNRSEFTLIDNAYFRRGTDEKPGELVTDPVYFTHISTLWSLYEKENGQTLDEKIHTFRMNIETFIFAFYQAYLLEFDTDSRMYMHSIYSNRQHLEITQENLTNLVDGVTILISPDIFGCRDDVFYSVFNPIEEKAIGLAFQHHNIPRQISNNRQNSGQL